MGFKFVERLADVPKGATVVFSAHGVSPDVREEAARRHLKVVDTTCPFVARVHRAARRFSEKGLPVIVLGDPDHVEVKGILGEIVPRKPVRGQSVGVVSQTTMNADDVSREIEKLRARYEVETMAETCPATKERQDAVRAFCRKSRVPGSRISVVVLGSVTSANSRRLCSIAADEGVEAFLAGTMDDLVALRPKLVSFDSVGVTSGASTPERFFDEAVRYLKNVPRHVAVIMDGNGRWALAHGKRRSEGHRAGAKTLERLLGWCGERGIRYLTVYAFSTENWQRPKEEVGALVKLLSHYLKHQFAHLVRDRVRFRVVGRRRDLPPAILSDIEDLERKTACFERQLIVALSYGGRAEIIDAVNRVKGPVTEETFRNYLYAPDVPDPDLVIRTSGERRVSNFLLWEAAYSEYHFTDVLWPDFSERDFDVALADYAGRNRRHGGHE